MMNDTQIDKYYIPRDHVNAKRIHPVSSSLESLQRCGCARIYYLWSNSKQVLSLNLPANPFMLLNSTHTYDLTHYHIAVNVKVTSRFVERIGNH